MKYKKALVVLLAVVIVGGALCGVYQYGRGAGYKQGYDKGKKDGSAIARTMNNPLADIMSRAPRTSVGIIKSITNSKIVINASNGEVKEFNLNDQTKVTQKTTVLQLSDLKVGQKVTVLTDGAKDQPNVTRIVVQTVKS